MRSRRAIAGETCAEWRVLWPVVHAIVEAMTLRLTSALVLAAATSIVFAGPASAAPSYRNCTELQKSYSHGIGRADAKDKTSGRPVTNFRRDTPGYNKAMRSNSGLDRDKDGIACERR